MIARVYPCVRLPRRFGFYDYRIPEHLSVSPGDIVRIRFRNRKTTGVVSDVVETSSFSRLFSIEEVIIPQFFSMKDVERLLMISEAIYQAPASVFAATFSWTQGRTPIPLDPAPAITSPSISKDIVESITETIRFFQDGKDVFVETSLEGECAVAHALRKNTDDQLLIVVPRAKLAVDIFSRVPLGSSTAVLTGQTPVAKRESILRHWQDGTLRTLVSTRIGPLLPAHRLGAVLVIESSSDDYRALARNPRIDARVAADLLARQHQVPIVHTGPVADVMSVFKKRVIIPHPYARPLVINLKTLQEKTDIFFITEELTKHLKETLQKGKDVLLSFNRKDTKEGSFVPSNTELAEQLRTLFPGVSVGVFDKRHQEHGRILLVTESFFKNVLAPFSAKRFGLVAEIDFDLTFSGVDYRAREQASYRLARLLSVAEQQGASCIVQTWMPDAIQELLPNEKFLREELTTRQQYRLPPVFPRLEIIEQENIIYLDPNARSREDLLNMNDQSIIVNDTSTYESTTNSHPSK